MRTQNLLPFLLVLTASCGDNKTTGPSGDVTPPARVLDLAANVVDGDRIALTWTTPGDDGATGRASTYDLRSLPRMIHEVNWDSAAALTSLPPPKPAGESETFTTPPLTNGTWYFALKTCDEVPNWSPMSEVVSAVVNDTVPPASIEDLTVVSDSWDRVLLRWTAPGNDGVTNGSASAYDLRQAREVITESSWSQAVPVDGLPAPFEPGRSQGFTVTGLIPGTRHFFAIKSVDPGGNWSELSNCVNDSTRAFDQRTFSSHAFGAESASWFPDGQMIMVQADWTQQGRFQLYRQPLTVGWADQLTDDSFAVGVPAVSPDGSKVAYSSMSLQGLCLLNVAPGSQPTVLIPFDGHQIPTCSWSPDGGSIVYAVILSAGPPGPQAWQIRTIPSSGGSSVALTDSVGMDMEPAWSPDGSTIAFASDRGGALNLWAMPAAGGNPVPLTAGPWTDHSPSWSPDSKWIAFTSDRSGHAELWIMSSDGEGPVQITTMNATVRNPSWSRDGSRILFSRSIGTVSDIMIYYVQ